MPILRLPWKMERPMNNNAISILIASKQGLRMFMYV